MGRTTDLAARAAFALAAIAILFAVRWDHDLQHFDWQVWEASNNLIDRGLNPYEHALLNAELQRDSEAYGPHFNGESTYVFLFSPPTWLATIRLVGGSALATSLLGAISVVLSMVVLTKDRTWDHLIGAVLGFVVFSFLGPGISTFRFGQTGILTAGLIGAQLVLTGTRGSGIPVSLLSMKPHLAFAAGIVEFVRRPKDMLTKIALPLAILVAVSVVTVGAHVWRDWVTFMTSRTGANSLALDMSIGTLSSLLPWDSLGFGAIAIGFFCSTALAWYCRTTEPGLVLLATVAVMAYLSGHAASHDWLWIVYLPTIMKWDPMRSAMGISLLGLSISAAITLSYELLNPQSVIGGFITAGLVFVAVRSARSTTMLVEA